MEHFARYLSAAGAALLVLSVAHDWAFLLALNRTFLEIPTTIADHIRSAIVWAPPLGCSMMLGLLVGALSPAWLDRVSKLPRWLLVLTRLGLLVVLAGVALTMPISGALILVALVCVFFFALKALDKSSQGLRLGLFGSALLLLVAIAWGYQAARWMTLAPPTVNVVVGGVEVAARGVRRFESVALIVDAEKRVHVVPVSAITSVRYDGSPDRVLACFLPGINC